MTIISLIVLIILVGVGLYVVNQAVPMQPQVKTILNAVVVLVLVLWLLEAFGVLPGYPVFRR